MVDLDLDPNVERCTTSTGISDPRFDDPNVDRKKDRQIMIQMWKKKICHFSSHAAYVDGSKCGEMKNCSFLLRDDLFPQVPDVLTIVPSRRNLGGNRSVQRRSPAYSVFC